MKSENRFYVYIHRRKTDGAIFYVGKGNGRRSGKVQGRNKYWHRVANKHGWSHHIVFRTRFEQCAFSAEKTLIYILNKRGVALTNATLGGEGTSGYIKTPETRRKISENRKGKGLQVNVRDSPSTSEKISTWWNYDGDVFNGSHVDLFEKIGVGLKMLKGVQEGRKFSYKGWKVVGVNNYPSNGNGIYNINSCKKIYNFYKCGMPNFIGTRIEFSLAYGLNSCKVSRLATGHKDKYKGWSCNEIQDIRRKNQR